MGKITSRKEEKSHQWWGKCEICGNEKMTFDCHRPPGIKQPKSMEVVEHNIWLCPDCVLDDADLEETEWNKHHRT